MLPISRPIRPDDFGLIAQIPGMAAIARDQDLRLFWTTNEFYRIFGLVDTVEEMMNKRLADVLCKSCAQEREDRQRRVIQTGIVDHHYQLSTDSRVLCTIMPLDEKAFGHKGILAIMKDARLEPRAVNLDRYPTLKTPIFTKLGVLSMRELEVLYYVAVGMSTQVISDRLCRATKTIEHHVNSIHTKLDTHSRAELVRFASERGIQAFSIDEWNTIVEGAKLIRNETIPSKAGALA
ncbi:MAG: LuxR C-terminal-related transcriptional regulator [Phycisphaerales bacterium]